MESPPDLIYTPDAVDFGVVALPINPKSVFFSFLRGNILAKPTSPSDDHLMSMNKPKVGRIIWKGLGTSPRVWPSLDSGPTRLRLCLPTHILFIDLPMVILVSLLMNVCLLSSLEILMSQNSCRRKLPHPGCICHCEWIDSVKLGILEGRRPLPACHPPADLPSGFFFHAHLCSLLLEAGLVCIFFQLY